MKVNVLSLMMVLMVTILITGCSAGSAVSKYPSKQITYSIPFNPGGQSDIEARRQQPMLEEILDQKVVITYKDGGGGAIGWSELVGKRPDGYFITGINIPHIVLQPLARDSAGYETEEINPVAIFQATPIALAVSKDSSIESLSDFIDQAKKNPGGLTVAGSGTYSGHHITLMQLQDLADFKAEYVPFSGAAPSIQAFLGGNTDAVLVNSSDLVKYQDDMKVLGIGSEGTFEPMPDIPTFKDLGYNMTASIDRGVAVPPKTDEEIIKKLEDAFLEIANDEKVKKEMIKEGFIPKSMGADESQEYINQKVEEMKPLVEKYSE
ncbi:MULTISPECIES: tripartite tricarboxylate transporter substrate binding protein [Pontibacillus]|uniref:Tripartite tricarboxylate transporter substrate binding protein n=1 Tax=Pontibacillus chungwhensis TaxID=265426 RepID=A0ABY8UUY8_9BACI|nr:MULTISPECIES: tripartite tricarboxylate transporter substrate binding protein [Pontibacillus]MCD5325243.1 tripartite tricarboxylate transporter substrate binding protein [Pontibacillus sp. HN14]WIF97491.1 tripartite tricarboxylate transporter substrate binding protein [Pontibacillus chungwhensis]